jgi:HSP20 family protein
MLTRWQPSALTQWQPFGSMLREVNRLRNEFNQLFGSVAGDNGWSALAASFPALNVWEDEANLFVEAELPGMELSDLEIYVTGGNQLTIKGERRQPNYEKSVWHRQERGFGTFVRTVTLPAAVDSEKVEARFQDGVLIVTLPKAEAAKPRKIAVKA